MNSTYTVCITRFKRTNIVLDCDGSVVSYFERA